MSLKYLTWTLLIAACGLQAYLVHNGSSYFIDLETVVLPFWLHNFSRHLLEHYLGLPFYIIAVLTLTLPLLTTILSWVFLGLRRKSGWNLALVVDLYFALPSLALISMNLIENIRYHHARIQNNPEVLLLCLASLHILILCSPPIRTLISPHPVPRLPSEDSILPITSAR
jgi:hypothetical protein